MIGQLCKPLPPPLCTSSDGSRISQSEFVSRCFKITIKLHYLSFILQNLEVDPGFFIQKGHECPSENSSSWIQGLDPLEVWSKWLKIVNSKRYFGDRYLSRLQWIESDKRMHKEYSCNWIKIRGCSKFVTEILLISRGSGHQQSWSAARRIELKTYILNSLRKFYIKG